MALTFNPFGLSLVEHKGGKPNYPVTQYPLAPTASGSAAGVYASFGQGDVVCISTTAASPGITKYATNANSANSAGYIVGVFDGIDYTAVDGSAVKNGYWPAGTPIFNGYRTTAGVGTDVLATINDLPYCVYKVQCNAPLQGNGAYFTNYNLLANGGAYTPANPTTTGPAGANPTTKQSTQALNVAGGPVAANSSLGSVKIIGLAPDDTISGPNNWSDPYPIVLVTLQSHTFNAPTPSAGIPA